jgi:hypothetical protein
VATLGVALTCSTALRANTIVTAQTPGGFSVNQDGPQTVVFGDTAGARMLRDAYIILARGDHDYNGHRVNAMQRVRDAADLLGLDLSGDLNAREPQPLSDEKMREAKGLILQVLGAAEVKDQKRVAKHLNEAVHQINQALGIK